MKKNLLRTIAIILPIGVIAAGYLSTPDKIIIPESSRYSAYPNGLVRLSAVDTESVGTTNITAELFGALPIKTVEVSVVPTQYVTVSGEVIGVRLYSNGIMVVGVEQMSSARLAGIKKGDIIEKINDISLTSTEQLSEEISKNKLNTLAIRRGDERFLLSVRGKEGESGYSVGMWVRDSAAGIGTLTFKTQNGHFGALGHAICDADTELLVPLDRGTISDCKVTSVKMGKSGDPGELMGVIGGNVIGTVEKNSNLGLYGVASDSVTGKTLPIATKYLVKEGSAELLCNIDGDGVKAYKIEIDSVAHSNKNANKSLTIRITDEELLSKTGGIVQGMSGSPIIQNGKLAGAVTHVFVNDATRGYGILIEDMLNEIAA